MSAQEVDEHLAQVPEPQRSTLAAVREVLVELLPDAEQGLAYGVPCLSYGRKHVAGFSAAEGHCSYLPMSGSVTAELADELTGWSTSKGTVRFPVDQPLPRELVARLVEARLREIRGG